MTGKQVHETVLHICFLGSLLLFLWTWSKLCITERRVAVLETCVEALNKELVPKVVYHDVQLRAHAEALSDWYRWREDRAQGWGSALYWASVVHQERGR